MSTTKRQNIALQNSLMKVAKIKHQLVREFLAETLGTFILVLFGNGAIAQFKGMTGMYLFIYYVIIKDPEGSTPNIFKLIQTVFNSDFFFSVSKLLFLITSEPTNFLSSSVIHILLLNFE